MSKYAMRRMMAKKNPLSIDGRIIPQGLQYAGGHDMGALHMSGAHYGMAHHMDSIKSLAPILGLIAASYALGHIRAFDGLLGSKKAVKANPRKRRRSNPSAHQARAAKAMRLYHSGQASSLKQAWKMV